MKRPLRVVLTSGDPDGIGTEIIGKALNKLGPQSGVQFYLWRSPNCPKKHLRLIDSEFKRITVNQWPHALAQTVDYKSLIDISSHLLPAQWVEVSAKASLYGHVDAMATAPLSKTAIKEAKMKDIGHTDILKRVTKSDYLFMAFLGKRFNVLLASGHIPLKAVARSMTAERIEKAVLAADTLSALLTRTKKNKPIALLGLNPHAGEESLIGDEESIAYAEAYKKLKRKDIKVSEPLVPDYAFFEENWKKYSVYVAPYHDQGLIPFKMIHGRESGVHITMGLPFVRTSVDHGTAKDIFGRNKADASSMLESIQWAIQLAKRKTKQGTKF